MSSTGHSAEGQLAGYLFQPERALYHLVISPAGSMVGIETLDDVAVLFPSGKQLWEQDKHAISNRSTIYERKVEFWKTLQIWSEAIEQQEIPFELVELHLVTTSSVTTGICLAFKASDLNPTQLESAVAELRKLETKLSKEAKTFATNVLARPDSFLTSLLSRVRIIDRDAASYGPQLRQQIIQRLVLPGDKADTILQSLLGWVVETAVALIRNRQPAWLAREDFVERYNRVLSEINDRRFLKETAAALIPVSDEKRAEHLECVFVKQMLWLGLEEGDPQLLDAIDDLIRSKTERIRLANKGTATLEDYKSFKRRLLDRWKMIFRKHGKSRDESHAREMGRTTLCDSLAHREPLAGLESVEYYLTRGAYHDLADGEELGIEPQVGWHPEFKQKTSDLLKNNSESNGGS